MSKNRSGSAVVLWLLVFCAALAAVAPGAAWSSEMFQVSQDVPYRQWRQQAGTLGEGNYIAVWQSHSSASSVSKSKVYYRVYDPAGSPVGERLSPASAYDSQNYPCLDRLSDGNTILVWADAGVIWGQLLDPAGNPMGDTLWLVQKFGPDRMTPEQPQVAALAGGGFAVTFTNGVLDGNPAGYIQIFENSGQARGEIAQFSPPKAERPNQRMAGLAGGGCVVVWEFRDDTSVGFMGIKARLVNADGGFAGEALVVRPQSTGDETQGQDPAVAGLADGDWAVLYTRTLQHYDDIGMYETQSRLYFVRYNASGALQAEETPLSPDDWRLNAWRPSVRRLPNGDLAVAWYQLVHYDNPDYSKEGIYLGRFSASTGQGESSRVTPQRDQLNFYDHPVLAVGGDDAFLVLWNHDDGDQEGVFGRTLP